MRRPDDGLDHDSARVVTRLRAAAVGAALAALCVVAAARGGIVVLPSTDTPVTAVPPLPSRGVIPPETLVPGRLAAQQHVGVAVDREGRPVRIAVRDRLVLRGTGDYSFVVTGPFEEVHAGPDSESEPGVRTDAVLWQGFSAGRRVLDAVARLRLPVAARHLPLRVSLAAYSGGQPLRVGQPSDGRLQVTLRLTNVASAAVPAISARIDPPAAAAVLDSLRSELESGRVATGRVVPAPGVGRQRQIRVTAPFRIAGELRLRARSLRELRAVGGTPVRRGKTTTIRFSAVLGDERPLNLVVKASALARGFTRPVVRVTAVPELPTRSLRPPGAATWSALAGSRRLDGERLLALATRATLEAALVRQYHSFVANPQGATTSEARYVYRTAQERLAAPPPTQPSEDRWGATFAVLIAATCLLAAGGLVVLWAHL